MFSRRSRLIVPFGAFLALAPAVLPAAASTSTPVDKDASQRDLMAGRAEVRKGHWEQAMTLLQRALKEDPSNAQIRLEIGGVFLHRGRYADADTELSRLTFGQVPEAKISPMLAATRLAEGLLPAVLEIAPCSDDVDCRGEVLALHAQARLGLKDIKGAAEDARAALAATPQAVPALLASALVLNAQGDRKGAEQQVDGLLRINPALPQARLLKANLLLQAGDVEGAIAQLREALTLSPKDVPSRVQLILVLIGTDRDREAGVEVDRLLADVPEDPGVPDVPDVGDDIDDVVDTENDRLRSIAPETVLGLYFKSLLLVRANDLPRALDTTRRVEALAVKMIPRSPYLFALIHAGNGNLEQALRYAATFYNSFHDSMAGLKLLSSVIFRIGDYGRVVTLLEPLHDRLIDDPEQLTILGTSYLALGRVEAANRMFAEAVKARPDDAMGRTRLAVSLTGRKQTQGEGIRELENLVKTNPTIPQIDVALVGTQFAAGNYEQAAEAAARMAKKRPDMALPLALQGEANVEMGRNEAAATDFEAALAKDPDFVPAAISLAGLHVRKGDVAAARPVLDEMLRRQPSNVALLLARADIEQQAGNLGAAQPFVETIITHSPGDADALARLIQISIALGDKQKAVSLAQDLARTHPGDVAIIDFAATVCQRLGATAQAVQMFRDLEARQPNEAEVSWRFGRLLAVLGRDKEARVEYGRAVAEEPELISAWIDYALFELKYEGLRDAQDVAQKAQAHNPRSEVALLLDGDLLRLHGDLAGAEAYYQALQQKRPSSRIASRIFQTQLKQGDKERALKSVQAWIAGHPEDMQIKIELAQYEIESGNFAAARDLYQRVVESSPRDAALLNNLAIAYDKTGDSRAVETARRALFLSPGSAGIKDTYGYMLYRRGNKAEGGELLREAYAASPDSPAIALHMAQLLVDASRTEEARHILQPLLASGRRFDEIDVARKLMESIGG